MANKKVMQERRRAVKVALKHEAECPCGYECGRMIASQIWSGMEPGPMEAWAEVSLEDIDSTVNEMERASYGE